jgi:tetratricopeptide (TPR) repeat protein
MTSYHTKPICPFCCSPNTIFKNKVNKWKCLDCQERFTVEDLNFSNNKAINPKKIFFSYGHDENRELVDKFKEDIEKRGHSVWIDYKEIGVWADWREKITEGISQSILAIAYLSKHSTRDPGVCLNEIALILDKPMEIKPILVESEEEATPPVSISHIQYLDLSRWRDIKESKLPEEDFDIWYEKKLSEVIHGIEYEDVGFSGDIDILRAFLRPLLFSSDIAHHIDGFTGRGWVFKEYNEWLAKESRLLWITGMPGFGKTAIAANLIHKYPSRIIGAWFCDRGSIEQSDPAKALMTISFQIACRLTDYRKKLISELALKDSISKDGIENKRKEFLELGRKDIKYLFRRLFSEPMHGLIRRENKYVIVIDALDEAINENGDNHIADLIASEFTSLPGSSLSFVATSRPDASVVNSLQGFKPLKIDALSNNEDNIKDLDAYLKKFFESDRLKNLPNEKKKEIHDTLLQKSEGVMLYLKEVVRAISEETMDIDKIRETPKGLYSLYSSQFKVRYGKHYEKKIKPLLRLIIASLGPIPEDLAISILKIDKERFNKSLNLLGSYIIKTTDGLKVFHKTIVDWLTSDKTNDYFIDLELGKKIIAEYLLDDFKNGREDNLYIDIVWLKQIKSWLPHLIEYSSAWNDPKLLDNFGSFLTKYLDIYNAVKIFDKALWIMENLRNNLGKRFTVGMAESLAKTYTNKGVALRTMGDNMKAVKEYTKAVKIREKIWKTNEGKCTPSAAYNLAWTYINKGVALNADDNYDGAIGEYNMAVKILEDLKDKIGERLTPDMTNSLAKAYANKGVAIRDKGDFKRSLEEFSMAIKIREELKQTLKDRYTPFMADNLAWTYINKGLALNAMNNFDGAIEEYDLAGNILEYLKNNMGNQFTPFMADNLASVHLNKGIAIKAKGDNNGAIKEYAEAIKISESLRNILGERFTSIMTERLISSYINNGIAMTDIASNDEAFKNYSIARKIFIYLEKITGKNLPKHATELLKLLNKNQDKLNKN